MADTKPRAAAPVDGGSVRPEHGRGASVEGDGVSYRGIVWFVVILTATTLVCQLLMWGLLEVFQDRRDVPARSPVAAAVTERQASEGRVYPDMNVVGIAGGSQPQLLVNEPANLDRFREQEHQTLTTYGWVDRSAGVVRIPVERAKDLLLERGLPVRGQGAPTETKKK